MWVDRTLFRLLNASGRDSSPIISSTDSASSQGSRSLTVNRVRFCEVETLRAWRCWLAFPPEDAAFCEDG